MENKQVIQLFNDIVRGSLHIFVNLCNLIVIMPKDFEFLKKKRTNLNYVVHALYAPPCSRCHLYTIVLGPELK